MPPLHAKSQGPWPSHELAYKHWSQIFNNDSTLTSAILDRVLRPLAGVWGSSDLASGGNGRGSRVPMSCAFVVSDAKNATAHNARAACQEKPRQVARAALSAR